MIEHKFTAEEIVEALECCRGFNGECEGCPMIDIDSCNDKLKLCAARIITKQKAELPPCKIGDTAYAIKTNYHSKRVHSGKVSEMYYVGEEMKLCIVVKSVGRGQWGKDVFGTYEEAERSLQNERRTSKDN